MKLINKISAWFKELRLKIKAAKDKYLPIAVKAVQAVKKAIESGKVEDIKNWLKIVLPDMGDVIADKVYDYAENNIPKLCVQLEILNASNNVDITTALAALKETYGDKWDDFMSGLAGGMYNMLADDGRIDAEEAKMLAKLFYNEYIKGVE